MAGVKWKGCQELGPVGRSKACGMEWGLRTQWRFPKAIAVGGWTQAGSAAGAGVTPQPGWPAGSVVLMSPGHALYCPCRERKASGRVVSLAAPLFVKEAPRQSIFPNESCGACRDLSLQGPGSTASPHSAC